ncbi:MarR family winged helix-turn-helix transcriptional regulator [Marinifilum caeruleilacunae]|uniref:MarR family transcriptional regulator n=1 Tax=Marinifilum caeruleilacunae TaxID=2499076 RepID=A0ABX1WVN1_9BACT|nr:MarR family transcriptional regulator [Marinifilum caeruleilacunae]NOU60153.1 MarR family transcriptional regulator [Marinifilum caeruleilacunae]
MNESIHPDGCLYFAANSLARHLNNLAENAFKFTCITPAYAFVMLEILKDPGLGQNELARRVNVKASTMTRFVDKLIEKQLIKRTTEGRSVKIFPTKEGEDFKPIIEQALTILHDSYCDLLGKDLAMNMTDQLQDINHILEK